MKIFMILIFVLIHNFSAAQIATEVNGNINLSNLVLGNGTVTVYYNDSLNVLDITGDPNTNFNLELNNTTITNSSNILNITPKLTDENGSNITTGSKVFDNNGVYSFYLGGSLNLDNNYSSGNYSGIYNISVEIIN